MNKQLLLLVRHTLNRSKPFQGLLVAWWLIMPGTGCASKRPAPLLVAQQARTVSVRAMSEPLSLKVVTYNIWGLPSWMTGAPSGRYPRIERELERLDPDLILLQEAWTAKARKAAPANRNWGIARAAGQHTFFQQSGLVTLSKFPILGGTFYPFSHAAFPDRFVNKGVLKITVQLPGGQVLNVWNVHLQDGGPPEIRRSQIHELLARVRAAEDDQVADLVGGDFNCTPESSLCRELFETLGPSLLQSGTGPASVTWDGLSAKPGAGETLDYIFLRPCSRFPHPQTTSHVVFTATSLSQRLSDHFGVEAQFDLKGAPTLAGASFLPVSAPSFAVQQVGIR